MSQVQITMSLDRRIICATLAVAMTVSAVTEIGAESVTLTTYYPAPSGVYVQMIVTKKAYLARDGGEVTIGQTATPGTLTVTGNSTFTGNAKISEGTLQLPSLTADPSVSNPYGALYFNSSTKQIKGYTAPTSGGTATWTPLWASAAASTAVSCEIYQTSCAASAGWHFCCRMDMRDGAAACRHSGSNSTAIDSGVVSHLPSPTATEDPSTLRRYSISCEGSSDYTGWCYRTNTISGMVIYTRLNVDYKSWLSNSYQVTFP